MTNVLYYHLAHMNGNFWKIFSRFYSNSKYKCDMYKGVKAIVFKPFKNLFSLFFGKKYIKNNYFNNEIEDRR